MVRVKKVKDLEKYGFGTVSRNGEYAMLNDGFAEVFEMSNMETILDFAKKYLGDLTDRCTKWYIHTKNDSILACQKDLLLCKLTEEDYEKIQMSKLNLHISKNTRQRREDVIRPYILEVRSLEWISELVQCLSNEL